MDAMQDLGACTSEQVAKKCGVNERYVQELLAVLYTSGLVEHDTKSDTFTLPSGVAALMVPSDSSLFGSFAQLVPTISRAYSSVINNGFIHGGGPSYADYGDFHEVRSAPSDHARYRCLFPEQMIAIGSPCVLCLQVMVNISSKVCRRLIITADSQYWFVTWKISCDYPSADCSSVPQEYNTALRNRLKHDTSRDKGIFYHSPGTLNFAPWEKRHKNGYERR